MSLTAKVIAVTLVAAIATFLLAPMIWPNPVGQPTPPASLLPLFIFLSVIESLAFGVGVAFLVFGYPYVRRRMTTTAQAVVTYLAVGWFLVNWWPHDNWHRINGLNFAGLAVIEYAFHFTLMVAGAALVWVFLGTRTQQEAT